MSAGAEWDQLNTLTIALTTAGSYDQAIELGNKAVETARTAFGPRSAQMAESLKNLGLAHLRVNEGARALVLLRQAVEIGEEVLPQESDDLSELHHQLGVALHERGEVREALQEFRRVLERREKHLGPDSPLFAKSLLELSRVLQESNADPADFEPLLLRGIDVLERRLAQPVGENEGEYDEARFDLAISYSNLGFARLEQRKPDEAMKHFERALELLEQQHASGGFIDPGFVQVLFENGMRVLAQLPDSRERQMQWGARATALLQQPMPEEVLAEGEFWVGLYQELAAWKDLPGITEQMLSRALARALQGDFAPPQLQGIPGSEKALRAFAAHLAGSRAAPLAAEALEHAANGEVPLPQVIVQLGELRMEEVRQSL